MRTSKLFFRYFWFSGRASRKMYWFGMTPWILWVAMTVLAFYNWFFSPDRIFPYLTDWFLSVAPHTDIAELHSLHGGELIKTLLILLLVVYFPVVYTSKRLHDKNYSGWWQVILYLPILFAIFVTVSREIFEGNIDWIMQGYIYSLIVSALATLYFLVILGFTRGTKGANKYGDDPLQE